MNKKGIVAALVAALCVGLTGCGQDAIPDMTDEQVNMIGEYVAFTMMKYDANHRSRLVDRAFVEKEPIAPTEPEPTKEPSGMGTVDNTPVVDSTVTTNPYTMEEVLALPDGVTLVYTGQRICDVYSDTGDSIGFSLPASKGKKLLVLSFVLNNATGQDQEVDVLSSGATFRITVNGSYSRNALKTDMLEDLATYIGSVPASSGAETVILVEVDETTASGIESISLRVKNDTKTYTTQLL